VTARLGEAAGTAPIVIQPGARSQMRVASA
jgi:hypothetical protein